MLLRVDTGPDATALTERIQQVLATHGAPAALALCDSESAGLAEDAALLRTRAVLHALMGQPGLADKHGRRACELQPDDPQCWNDLGRVQALGGLMKDAAMCFRQAVIADPRFSDGWQNLGQVFISVGDPEAALAALKRALAIDPAKGESWLLLGSLLVRDGQLEDALRAYDRAVQCDATLARARIETAQVFSGMGKVRRAEKLFRQSLALDSNQGDAWIGLGKSLEELGEVTAARDAYVNALRVAPTEARALGFLLALLGDAGQQADFDPAPYISKAKAALGNDTVRAEARAVIGYGLAKYHDRNGDTASAAKAGLHANAARRSVAGPLDRAALDARVAGLTQTYTRAFFHERRRFGLGNGQPVFIVGLPRSGTTLTEQIIASHPRLHGSGELQALSQLAGTGLREDDAAWQAAERLDEASSRNLAIRYLRALREGAPRRQLRYVDKSPLNLFALGFAALLFPQARVIWCRRRLADTALSIWFENFNREQTYATDFDDLAYFGGAAQQVMWHWQQALPLPILEVDYEALIADTGTQSRRIIDFLGAPWDDACLEFHKSARAVQTPSRWQVRQPINRKGLGRAELYAPHLPDLVKLLAGDAA